MLKHTDVLNSTLDNSLNDHSKSKIDCCGAMAAEHIEFIRGVYAAMFAMTQICEELESWCHITMKNTIQLFTIRI